MISRGCRVQLLAHREVDTWTVGTIGVTYLLRDRACGVVRGQIAAFYVEDTVLGSATITATWGRSARSDTLRTDGRGA